MAISATPDLSWTDKYFSDPVSTIGSYVALLLLRFERRNNYERVIDLEELLSQAKLTLRNILGSQSATTAYEIGLRFLHDVFEHHPEALQAKFRFHLLENIEAKHYPVIRKSYITAVLPEVSKLDDAHRLRLHKLLSDLRFGKVPLIDKTSCGSLYLLKLDLFYYSARLSLYEQIQELQDSLARCGVVLPEYTRIIVPAPILEDVFLKQLLQSETRTTDIVVVLENKLRLLGYVLSRIDTVELTRGRLTRVDFVKNLAGKNFSFRVRLYIGPSTVVEDAQDVFRILADVNSTPRPHITFIICKQISEKARRAFEQHSLFFYELQDLELSKVTPYVTDLVLKTLLDISATAALHTVASLVEDLYKLFYTS